MPLTFNACRLIRIAVFGCCFAHPLAGFAHSPHDVTNLLAVSPAFEQDQTLYVKVGDRLLRSTDRGLRWKRLVNGLTNKSKMTSLAISPRFALDGTLFLGTRADGIYLSTNRGDSWAPLATHGALDQVRSLDLIQGDDGNLVLLALTGTGGVHVSQDGGSRWQRMAGFPRAVRGAALTVQDGHLMIAAVDDGSLIIARPDGRERKVVPVPDQTLLDSVQFGPQGEVLVSGVAEPVVWQLERGGAKLQRLGALPDGLDGKPGGVTSLGVARRPGGAAPLVASAWHGGAYRSLDGGSTWQPMNRGLTKTKQADEFKRPHFGKICSRGRTVFLAGFDGLFRSDDSGDQWYELETLRARLPTSLAVGRGPGRAHRLFLTTFDGGVYHSADSGKHWDTLNMGLRETHLWSVSVAPGEGEWPLVAVTSNRTVYLRETHESVWREALVGCKARLARRSWFDRLRDKIRILRGEQVGCRGARKTFPHAITFSPDYPNSRLAFFGTRYQGIHRSTDGGYTWSPLWDEQDGWITAFEVALQRGRLEAFASVRGRGFYRSQDGGSTWHSIDTAEMEGAAQETPTKYLPIAVSPNFGEDAMLFAGTPAGLFRSSDGGDSWKALTDSGTLPRNAMILAVATTPTFAKDGRVLVSAKGLGLFSSRDRGNTFEPVATDLLRDNHLLLEFAFSPAYHYDQTVYAISSEELLVSTNGGHSWSVVPRPVRYEDDADPVILRGEWEQRKGIQYSGYSAVESAVAGSKVELRFSGTGISLVAPRSLEQGIARVWIDGVHWGLIDQYAPEPSEGPVPMRIGDLESGGHRLALEVTGTRNRRSRGFRIVIDAFQVDNAW